MDQFAQRRVEFAETLGNGIAIIPAGAEATRNDDVHYEFRQDSSFYFLTGFDEPDAVAIIDPSHPTEKYTLFVRPRDREMEIWNGYRAGTEGAVERFGADQAFPIGEFSNRLKDHLIGTETVFYRSGGRLDSTVFGAMQSLDALADRYGRTIPSTLVDPSPRLAELRLRKTQTEIEHLTKACEISAAGHEAAMKAAQPGMFEYQVQSAMESVFREQGSARNGYPSIVASGPNACILHYVENTRQMADGDLLLIDAAAEYEYFSSDITRTFPVNGTFSKAQRAVYNVVLAAQRAAIGVATVGNTHADIHETAKGVLTDGLVDLGLLPRGVDDSLAMNHYREYFMHGTGHWLGMDVHDAGSVRVGDDSRILEVGMSFTVEPGIYISPDSETIDFPVYEYDVDERYERRYRLGWDAARKLEAEEMQGVEVISHPIPEEFRGIGVRIEDDLVVMPDGTANLTASLPTDPDDVEALCQS